MSSAAWVRMRARVACPLPVSFCGTRACVVASIPHTITQTGLDSPHLCRVDYPYWADEPKIQDETCGGTSEGDRRDGPGRGGCRDHADGAACTDAGDQRRPR